MDSAVVRNLLDFFQDFLNLCQQEDWPNSQTTESEIKNAFLIAQHVQNCIFKLQKRNLFEVLLSTINDKDDSSDVILKSCLTDPPKHVLKMIVNSKSNINLLDVAIMEFERLFSERRFEDCLTDFMVEAASVETLTRNMSKFPRNKVLHFKSNLLLVSIDSCEDHKELLLEMFQKDKDILEILVVSLLNKDVTHHNAVVKIKDAFICAMSNKSNNLKEFWKNLLNIDENLLTNLCLEHSSISDLITKALVDSSRLLREHMSAEFFYIDLSYSELVAATQKICGDDNLRVEFLINFSGKDLQFWEGIIS